MKAIRVHEFGGPEVLKLEEVAKPKPSAGQVLVRIHAAGVNPYETYMRAGTYALKPPLPYTPGSDGAGVVDAVGEGVKKVSQGTTYTPGGPSAVHMPNTPWRLKSKCIRFRRKLISSKAQESGCLMGPHIMRCITREGARFRNRPGTRRKRRCGYRGRPNWPRHGSDSSWHCRDAKRTGNRETRGGASSLRPSQIRISGRNPAIDRQPRRGHHSGDARQCEPLQRHEAFSDQWARHRDW